MKALLIDYGGVMTEDLFAAMRVFCEDEGVAPDALADAWAAGGEAPAQLAALERGGGDIELANRSLAVAAGIADHVDLIQRLFSRIRLDGDMVAGVRALRAAGVRTCLCSNSWDVRYYESDVFEELFDVVVISGQVGLRKPEPEIYAHAAAAVGAEPRECVFVDDMAINLRPAQDMGMTALLHRDAATTLPELDRLFGVSPR
jgi:epoxide hydrolase-like predicted phosphatase